MRSKVSSIVAAALLAILTLSVSTDALAQARPSSKGSILSVEPFGLLGLGQFRHVQMQYEWRLTQDNSIALRAILAPVYVGYSAFGFGGSYRFYIADGRALTGLNVSPGAEIYFIKAGEQSSTGFAIGGDVAYKWIFDSFGVEPYFRLRQGIAENAAGYGTLDYNFGVYLGYAW